MDEDKENTYTAKDTREIKKSNKNEGVVKTNLPGQSDTEIWRLSFNDTLLVRYYQRTSWKYYVGLLTDVFKKEDKSYFTIRFLKTIKKPELKFVVQKIKDEDTVTEDFIVKQVRIHQNTKRPKEYFLADPSDKIYFE